MDVTSCNVPQNCPNHCYGILEFCYRTCSGTQKCQHNMAITVSSLLSFHLELVSSTPPDHPYMLGSSILLWIYLGSRSPKKSFRRFVAELRAEDSHAGLDFGRRYSVPAVLCRTLVQRFGQNRVSPVHPSYQCGIIL